jgi:hypothetical protein
MLIAWRKGQREDDEIRTAQQILFRRITCAAFLFDGCIGTIPVMIACPHPESDRPEGDRLTDPPHADDPQCPSMHIRTEEAAACGTFPMPLLHPAFRLRQPARHGYQ